PPATPCSTAPRPATPRPAARRRSCGARHRPRPPARTGRRRHAPAGSPPSARRRRRWHWRAGHQARPAPRSLGAPVPRPASGVRDAAPRRRRRPRAVPGRRPAPRTRPATGRSRPGWQARSVVSLLQFLRQFASRLPLARQAQPWVRAPPQGGRTWSRAGRRSAPRRVLVGRTIPFLPPHPRLFAARIMCCTAQDPRRATWPGAGTGTTRASEVDPQGGRVAAVVDVPGRHPVPGAVLFHDGPLLGVVEVVHLQAQLHVVVDAVEDRAVELAEVVAENRQLPRDAAVLAV